MKLLSPKAILTAVALTGGCCSVAIATTVLQPNDVQIVAYASDAPDAIAFVTWVELDPGTEIRFTDKGWTGTELRSGESELIFTAQSTVPPGSVFEYIDDMDTAGTPWNLASGSFSLSGSSSDPGDQILVYQGALANPSFVFAFDNTGGWEASDPLMDQYSSALPPGLVNGVSAVSFEHSDSFWYRPWYAKSAMLETLKEWMVNRNRFKTTSTSATRLADYVAPLDGFTIRNGQRGDNTYTEYIPGTAPCIILTGHDGDLKPIEINDRNHGCSDGQGGCDWSKTCSPQDSSNCRAATPNDENTQDMARRANDYFEGYTGHTCHLVVNRLARIKLDPNREVEEAAQFDQTAIDTYNDFHAFADLASQDIENNHPCGAGLLVDFHGHTHPEARIEMGYKLSSSQLRGDDASVDGLAYTSSIKNMPTHKNQLFSEIVRGSTSMGALFELPTAINASGYLSVPSPMVNAPAEGEDYFQGGYNVETHGSQDGGAIDGVQIEFPRYLRAQNFTMQEDMLIAFAEVVLPQMLASHYPAACDVLGGTPGPTDTPTAGPTYAPTPNPTPSPTGSPTSQPTEVPTPNPTPSPTDAPTPGPTDAPTPKPVPTDPPTPQPTEAPTPNPTPSPTVSPSPQPTEAPTQTPTSSPTNSPTPQPTDAPTPKPTPSPTNAPVVTVDKYICTKNEPLPATICADGSPAGGNCATANSNNGSGNGGKKCWWAACPDNNGPATPGPTSPPTVNSPTTPGPTPACGPQGALCNLFQNCCDGCESGGPRSARVCL